jgi:hypothetical protein
MKYLLWLVTIISISSCTTTSSYYHLTSTENWSQYGSACSGLTDSYVRKLSDGVQIKLAIYRRKLSTDFFIIFYVEKGKSVKLVDNEIVVRESDVKNEKKYLIDRFISGRDVSGQILKVDPSLKVFQVETVIFGPTDLLVGFGRFERTPNGENLGDQYETIVTITGNPIDKMSIEFPPIIVNGESFLLAPLFLEYSQSTRLLCFQ